MADDESTKAERKAKGAKIIERALKEGFKSGGTIGDISGGLKDQTVSVSSGGGGGSTTQTTTTSSGTSSTSVTTQQAPSQPSPDLQATRTPTPDSAIERALILQAAQQQVPGSPQFEALRARTLAETKEEIEAPVSAEIVTAGNVFIGGTVSPFRPRKESVDEATRRVAETFQKQGKLERVEPGRVFVKEGEKVRVIKVKPRTITRTVQPTPRTFEQALNIGFERDIELRTGIQEETEAVIPAGAVFTQNLVRFIQTEEPEQGLFAEFRRAPRAAQIFAPIVPITVGAVEEVEKAVTKPAFKIIEKNTRIIEQITQKVVPDLEDRFRRQAAERRIAEIKGRVTREQFQELSPLGKRILINIRGARNIDRGVTDFFSGAIGGVTTELRERPREAILTAAAIAVAQPLIGAAFSVRFIGPRLRFALPAAFATTVVARTVLQPTPFEAGVTFGRIAAAEVAPAIVGIAAGTKISRVIARKTVEPKELVPVRIDRKKITTKEFKKLQKIATKVRDDKIPEEIRRELGIKADEFIEVPINKLSSSQIKFLAKLTAEGKINMPISFVLEATPRQEVGFAIDRRRPTSRLELEASKRASEKFLKLFAKEVKKTQITRAKSTQEIQTELEKTIRQRMAKTGKTAREVFKDIQKEKEFRPLVKKIQKAESEGVDVSFARPLTSRDFVTGRERFQEQITSGAFQRFPGLAQRFGGRRQALLLRDEELILRGVRPVQPDILLEIPSLARLRLGGRLEQFARAARPIAIPTTRLDTVQEVQQTPIQVAEQDVQSLQTQVQLQETQFETRQALTSEQLLESQLDTVQEQGLLTDSVVVQEPRVSPITDVVTESEVIQESVVEPVITPREEPPPRPEFLPELELPGFDTLEPGYHGEIKERGRFRRITDQPEPRGTAINQVLDAVDNTTAVTGRIKRTQKAVRSVLGEPINVALSTKFDVRPDKQGTGQVFVEKNRFRIDTPGEIQGITLQGLKARRRNAFAGFI